MKKRSKAIILACILCIAILTGAAYHKDVYNGEAIYANGTDAVFYIRSLKADGTLRTAGTGFIISKDGKALTATHVVRDAAEVHAVLQSGKEVTLTVEFMDDYTDVAVLRLPKGSYKFLKLSTAAPAQGENVYAIGYPLKTAKVIHAGMVSNPCTPINGIDNLLINIDFASGMSGGPIISHKGTVCGIVSASVITINGDSASPTMAQIKDALAGINSVL